MDRDAPVLTVLGELVVDLLPVPDADAGPEGTAPHYVARPGGNALNVAVAAGRLATPVALLARLGTGPMATSLRRHAELSGVDVSGLVAAAEPVSLAVVGLGPDGSPDYGFHVQGAADWRWTDEELAAVLPAGTAVLHVGSISSWTPPGSERSPGWPSGWPGPPW
jgi:Sugar kinases, ribokinase family